MTNYVLLNGTLTPPEKAFVSVDDRGFRYGDSVFETIAVTAGIPYQLEWHMGRLARGLSSLRIIFDTKTLPSKCCELLHANAVSDGILRIQISRGVGSRGYMPDSSDPRVGATCVIQTLPLPPITINPAGVWLSNYQKISAKALPVQHKLGQGLNSILARIEASENGGIDGHACADALLLNERGEICETSSGNLFWFNNNVLYTPALSCGVLEGSTRHALMRLSPYPIQEVVAPLETLRDAEAVFMTNVVWPVRPIGALFPQKWQWDSEKLASYLRELLLRDRGGAKA